MKKRLSDFKKQLKETNFSLKDYVDFPKIVANVEAISIKLHQLNYLIGQEDMGKAVERLWEENHTVFSVLDILIAVRKNDKKKVVNENGDIQLVSDFFSSPEQVTKFLNDTGLTEIFRHKQIKNLVDYVFGVEVGLDSNARKNRGGHIMEGLVAQIFDKYGISYYQEVSYTEFPEIVKALGVDNKRFDFVVKAKDKTYLIETNFYTGGGSKLNEVARSYSDLAPKINAVPGFEFVWITDGIGWISAWNKLEEAFEYIPSVYNLTNIITFIDTLRNERVK